MRLFCLFLASTLAAASPVSYVNTDPTIWSEDAVTSMKQSIDIIYQINVELYHKRKVFNGTPKCSAPGAPSNFSHTAPTACSIADAFLAAANNVTMFRFQDLAKAMFPVSFGLPDNNKTPRASFSDFSHFYNYMLIEGTTFLNISAWHICKADIKYQTESARSFANWLTSDASLDTIDFGPAVGGDGPFPDSGYNGTLNYYGSPDNPSKFIDSISLNTEELDNAYFLISSLLQDNDQDPTKDAQYCADLLQKGLMKPTPPKDFPHRK